MKFILRLKKEILIFLKQETGLPLPAIVELTETRDQI
jgi:hypothetical protein